MKFIIYRTYGEGKPCEEAKEEEVAIQYPWEGKPHKDKVWVVEINTLEELMKLFESIKKQINPSVFDGIIIADIDCKEIPYNIEIYNDWKE